MYFFLSVQTLGCCRWRYTNNASQSTTSASLVSFIENSKILWWLKELTLHRWETWNNYHIAWGSRWPSPWVHPCTLVFAMETSQVGGQWGELPESTQSSNIWANKNTWKPSYYSVVIPGPQDQKVNSMDQPMLPIWLFTFIAHRKQTFQLFAVIKPLPGWDGHH